jgi:hypothetical protein
MSATISTATRIHSAKKFIESLSEVYFFASKLSPWSDEQSPNPASNQIDVINEARRGLLFMKKAEPVGILGLKRFDWTTGIVYTPWDSKHDLHFVRNWLGPEQPFYAFVQDVSSGVIQYNVYLCIDNNDGTPSLDSPTGQSTDVFETIDGYKWKFMYNLHPDYLEYVNSSLIPCPITEEQKTQTHLTVEQTVTPGTINRVEVTVPGSGYSGAMVSISGDGTGASASVTVENNEIKKVTITNPGANYTFATVTVTGDGVNAECRAIVSPIRGHGSNAAAQLGATHAMTKQTFRGSELGLFEELNAYRIIGLIKDIKDSSGELLVNTAYSLMDALEVTNITSNFPYVQKIIGLSSDAEARIFKIDPPNSPIATFYISDKVGSFAINEFVQLEGSPSTIAQVTNIINNDVNKKTGDIIYLEHLQSISRSYGQSESFIFSIEF